MIRPGIRISLLAAFLLVVLRLAIGWHFLYEGLWKYENPGFSAEAFLRQARGPFAEKFHDLIPDYDGCQRLDADAVKKNWEDLRSQFATFYALSEEQAAESKSILQRKAKQAESYLNGSKEEIQEYLAAVEAKKQQPASPELTEIPFQQKRAHEATTKLRAKAAPWLAEVDRLDKELHIELAMLLDKDQRDKGLPSQPKSTLEKVDSLTTYGLMAIGFCLLVGLFTRLACLAGALFLLQVVLCQPAWPALYPPLPPSAGHSLLINKEVIEMITLLALAATPVGRWGGVDFLIHYLLIRPFYSAKEASCI